jgi:hypothetical protein
MSKKYQCIAEVVAGSGGVSSLNFTSIPDTYTDLQILVSLRASGTIATIGLNLYYNSSNSGYSYRRIDGSGSSVDSSTAGAPSIAIAQGGNATANTFGNYIIYIPNYAGSANKTATSESVNENNATQEYASLYAHIWANTAAITSIQLTPSSGTLLQYSSATLYGIRKS